MAGPEPPPDVASASSSSLFRLRHLRLGLELRPEARALAGCLVLELCTRQVAGAATPRPCGGPCALVLDTHPALRVASVDFRAFQAGEERCGFVFPAWSAEGGAPGRPAGDPAPASSAAEAPAPRCPSPAPLADPHPHCPLSTPSALSALGSGPVPDAEPARRALDALAGRPPHCPPPSATHPLGCSSAPWPDSGALREPPVPGREACAAAARCPLAAPASPARCPLARSFADLPLAPEVPPPPLATFPDPAASSPPPRPLFFRVDPFTDYGSSLTITLPAALDPQQPFQIIIRYTTVDAPAGLQAPSLFRLFFGHFGVVLV